MKAYFSIKDTPMQIMSHECLRRAFGALIWATLALWTAIPAKAQSNGNRFFGDYTYVVVGGSSITIVGYKDLGNAGDLLVIPASITTTNYDPFGNNPNPVTYPVTSIGGDAFQYCNGLTNVTIPDGVTNIGYGAFDGCHNLKSVMIPGSVTTIGDSAFADCYNLTNVTIPGGVTSINEFTFLNCYSLTSMTIPNLVTNIGDVAFNYCTNLTHVTIGSSVISIGNNAFQFCYNLTNVIIPNSVTSIGDSAFNNCYGLTSMMIPARVTNIGTVAFYACVNLRKVTIGNGVSSIGERAFESCYALTNIEVIEGNSSYSSVGGVLFNKNSLMRCPAGLSGNYVIPYGITNIGNEAFLECNYLTNVFIANSLISIGDQAFESCSNLMSITIPDSVTSIGIAAFRDCAGLTSATLGNSLTSLGYQAFESCDSLMNIRIPNSVTNIDVATFAYCGSLTNATIGNGVTKIGYDAFLDCRKLTSVSIGSGVTSIDGDAFGGSGLRNITIPDSVTNIGYYAFEHCGSLTNVTVGRGVASIGDGAFYYCSSLRDIFFLGNAPVVGNSVFQYTGYTTAYYWLGTYGWTATIGGIPTVALIPDGITMAITTQPASQTVAPGGTATFAISTYSTAPLNYYWQSNDVTIQAGTQTNLTLTNLTLAASGTVISCLISNVNGTLASSNAILTVMSPPSPPANDQCSGTIMITNTDYTNAQSTVLATSTGDPATPSFLADGVWYAYTPASDGTLSSDTIGSDFDTVLAMYSGDCGSMSLITYDDEGGGNSTSALSNPVSAGATYYFLAGGYYGAAGNLIFHLHFQPAIAPSNDQCSGAIVITGTDYTNTQSTVYATSVEDPPTPSILANGVWYAYTPANDGTLISDTIDSDFDTVLAMYSGGCGSMSLITYDDEGGGNSTSALTNTVSAGITYYFLPGGYYGATGNLVFHLHFQPANPTGIVQGDGSFGIKNGMFGFDLNGESGQVIVVEASTNLISWMPLLTNTLGGSPFYFSDPSWTNYPGRYYRVRP